MASVRILVSEVLGDLHAIAKAVGLATLQPALCHRFQQAFCRRKTCTVVRPKLPKPKHEGPR